MCWIWAWWSFEGCVTCGNGRECIYLDRICAEASFAGGTGGVSWEQGHSMFCTAYSIPYQSRRIAAAPQWVETSPWIDAIPVNMDNACLHTCIGEWRGIRRLASGAARCNLAVSPDCWLSLLTLWNERACAWEVLACQALLDLKAAR